MKRDNRAPSPVFLKNRAPSPVCHKNRAPSPIFPVVFVGFFWIGMLASVYLATNVTTWGVALGFIFLMYQDLWLYKRKKTRVLPHRFFTSRFYDVFVRQPKERKGLAGCLKAGHFFLAVGFVITWAMTNDLLSPRYLKDMDVIKGRFEDARRQNGKGGGGNYILTFRKENGESVRFLTYFTHGVDEDVVALQRDKEAGGVYTVWGCLDREFFFPLYPERRRHPSLKQIVGDNYQRLWNEDRQRRFEQTEHFLLKIGMILVCLAVPFYLYGWFVASKHSHDGKTTTSMKQEK